MILIFSINKNKIYICHLFFFFPVFKSILGDNLPDPILVISYCSKSVSETTISSYESDIYISFFLFLTFSAVWFISSFICNCSLRTPSIISFLTSSIFTDYSSGWFSAFYLFMRFCSLLLSLLSLLFWVLSILSCCLLVSPFRYTSSISIRFLRAIFLFIYYNLLSCERDCSPVGLWVSTTQLLDLFVF